MDHSIPKEIFVPEGLLKKLNRQIAEHNRQVANRYPTKPMSRVSPLGILLYDKMVYWHPESERKEEICDNE